MKASRERRLVQLRAEAEALARNPTAAPPTPAEALLQELDRTHRTIAGLELQLAASDELGPLTLENRAQLNDRLMSERGHYTRLAAECVRLHVSPEAQSVAESHGLELKLFIEVLLRRMGFDPFDPELVAVVRSTLKDLDAGLLGRPQADTDVVPSFAGPGLLPGRVIEGRAL